MKKSRRNKSKDRPFNKKKYNELMLYVISQGFFGIKKLQWLMQQSDFTHYAKHGKSMTGETYRKRKGGIVGDHFDKTLTHLMKRGDVVYKTRRGLEIKWSLPPGRNAR